ncbi:MazG-like family protein [Streptococcus suis]
MTKTLDEKVEQWFIDRNLHEANPVVSFKRVMEDTSDLFKAVSRKDSLLIENALGSMQIFLNGLELQIKNGAEIKANPEEMELLLMVTSLGHLADKLHKHIFYDETKTPLIKPDLIMLHSNIHSLAIHNCTTADTCLKIAYDEIKDRKGKMIDGVFVKEADL